MKRSLVVAVLVAGTLLVPGVAAAETAAEEACWGQVSSALAQLGDMGEHSSAQETPRLGLRNVARALHAEGILEDDSMQALGSYVADSLGLEVDACR